MSLMEEGKKEERVSIQAEAKIYEACVGGPWKCESQSDRGGFVGASSLQPSAPRLSLSKPL